MLRRPSFSIAPIALIVLTALSACAGNPAASADNRYDFGPRAESPPAESPAAARVPPLKVLDVAAPATLASDNLIYRLDYADAQRIGVYANSHWTTTPAQLLTQRLRGALSANGAVLSGGDAVRAPILQVELTEFEQVFDSRTASHAAITARATLIQDGKMIGQQTFRSRAPSSSNDAAGGARALAAASDDLVAQISAWLGMQAPVASR